MHTIHPKKPPKTATHEFFRKVAHHLSAMVGTSWAFAIAVSIIILWLFSRPLFESGDTWQLVINTGTTIVTFLMVFLIQNVQNRDAKAIHLKLDELIRSVDAARNKMMQLEELSDAEIEEFHKEFLVLKRESAEKERAKENAPAVEEPF